MSGIGKQYGKLITAKARSRIGLANRSSQNATHCLKCLISFGMTMGVIDGFEIVQVQVG